jgi:hypothetical protein
MEMGAPVVGEGCWRMEMGEDGVPQGVLGVSVATCVKPGRDWRPVPPMTAMGTGAVFCCSCQLLRGLFCVVVFWRLSGALAQCSTHGRN